MTDRRTARSSPRGKGGGAREASRAPRRETVPKAGSIPAAGLPASLVGFALALTFFAEASRMALAHGAVSALAPDAAVDAILSALPGAAAIGCAAAMARAAACAWIPAARRWRARLACAAGGLYLAAAAAAVGAPGLTLGAAAVAAALGGLAVRRVDVVEDGTLVALHAGMFGSALCLYATWPRIAAAWPPFQDHLAAMAKLLL